MSEAYKCSRCGNLFEADKNRAVVVEVREYELSAGCVDWVEQHKLCSHCYERFQRWMKALPARED